MASSSSRAGGVAEPAVSPTAEEGALLKLWVINGKGRSLWGGGEGRRTFEIHQERFFPLNLWAATRSKPETPVE